MRPSPIVPFAFASLSLAASACSRSARQELVRHEPASSVVAAIRSKPAPVAHLGMAASTDPTPAATTLAPAAIGRAMRVTIDSTIVVHNLDGAVADVRTIVTRHGGYVGDARTVGRDEARSASFELHVPIANLPAFRAEIAALGEGVADAEKTEDVTEQRADLTARLVNARAQEKRLNELMAVQTSAVADVLAVQREVGNVRESIERMDAQQRSLEGEVSLATVRLQLSMQPPRRPPTGALARIAHAARDGVEAAGEFVVGSAVFAVAVAPTLSIVLLAAFGCWRLWRAIAPRLKASKLAARAA